MTVAVTVTVTYINLSIVFLNNILSLDGINRIFILLLVYILFLLVFFSFCPLKKWML